MVAGLAVVLVVSGASNIGRFGAQRDSLHAGLGDLPKPTSGWLQVSAGVDHSCGVRADGTAWCWGSNAHGQLGDGTKTSSRAPVQVAPVPAYDPNSQRGSDPSAAWTLISAGSMNSCALRSDHTAWCWGWNRYGQLGTPEVHGGTQSCNIGGTAGNTEGCWGPDHVHPQQLVDPYEGPLSMTSIDTGDKTSCGVDDEGLAWCWGWAELLQGTNQGPALSPIDGTGYSFDQVASDGAHTCAVNPEHRLSCWGSSAFGELGTGTASGTGDPTFTVPASDWELASPGTRFTCGLRSPGSAWCWGLNERGQLGTGNTAPRFNPARTGNADDWAALDSGGAGVCGIRTPGSLWCWGDASDGQLGIGRVSYRSIPTRVGAGAAWVQVSSGAQHACAVDAEGTAWCWGNNRSGQLGDGTTTTTRWHPTEVRFE